MTRISSSLAVVVLLALLCVGCIAFPVRYTERPGASGVVFDGDSENPVEGATVRVAPGRGEALAGTALTMADGSFFVPPRRRWGLFVIPSCIFHFPFTLSVQHDGYEPSTLHFARLPIGGGTSTNFGKLSLKKLAQ